jgi:diamine N-acetyltransferase
MSTLDLNATIRPATPDDASALSALGRRTFADAFGKDNSPADLTQFLDATYSPQIQRGELRDPLLSYLVVERGSELVGFALLRSGKASPFVADASALEVQRFYVDQSCHGTGIAQALMAACVDHAMRSGAGTLFLGVWEKNPRALRFYAREGFVEVGRQIFQVGSDPQQDLVLARRLAAPPATASFATPE